MKSRKNASKTAVRVSAHAAQRWIERVDPGASFSEARMAVAQFIALGRARPCPRRFMRGQVRQEPGTRFVYNARRAGVCAVITEGVVATILTRELFGPRREHLRVVTCIAPPTAADRARWRWGGDIDEIDEAA